MINFIADNFYYLFIALILFNFFQRKQMGKGQRKRMASLIISIMVFILYIGAILITVKNLSHLWILLPVAVDISLFLTLKNRIMIFRKNCEKCGGKLSYTEMLSIDSNLCSNCEEGGNSSP